MSGGTRNFFAKLTHFFERHFSSPRRKSGSSNADVSSEEPSPTLQPTHPSTSSPPGPPCLPAPPPRTLPLQPQCLAPPISRVSLPTARPLPIPPSVQPPPHSTKYPTPSSPSCDAPGPLPNFTSRPLALRQATPSPQQPTWDAPIPQSVESTRFAGAHDFIIYNPHFNDTSRRGAGLKELLKHSMPGAFHNSAARYPPPKCHLGTRNDYITKITDWALGNSDHDKPVLWMRGPFGIGKSAVAQSCAEALQSENKLAATLFFSRSNADRDDPRRVFTSIAYQIAALCEPFSDIVDVHIRKDPAVVTKSLSTQFEELLVRPLGQVDITSSGIDGCVVIIDGLDECRGTPEQCEIIRVIAASVRDRMTPFRWFITSRPEDPIIRTMKSPVVSSVSLHLELPVSRKIDHEILLYLTDEFKKIRESHGLAESWPSEKVFALLVDRTAGLWIYVTTITRFISDENSLGPEDQLRIVLAFLKDVSAKVESDNPLTEMDFFYTLIMQRVPLKIRIIVRKILLLRFVINWQISFIAGVLGLPEEQFRRSCASIQSVMELQGSNLDGISLHFHHASFLDFMKDPKRSKELCIYGDFLIEHRREQLDWLHQVCSRSTGPMNFTFPSEPVLVRGWDHNKYYASNLKCFWDLCCVPNHPFDLRTAVSLEKVRFRMMLRLMGDNERRLSSSDLQCLRDNLPTELRDKIIRRDKCPTRGCTNTMNVLILGHGENETVTKRAPMDSLELINNQDPVPGRCFCGSRIK